MRKLDLRNYDVEVMNEKGEFEKKSYNFKGSLIELLFVKTLNLDSMELLSHDSLAKKIMQCKDDSLLIEEAEYQMLTRSIQAVRGFGRHEVGLVNRIMNETKTVEVAEAKE